VEHSPRAWSIAASASPTPRCLADGITDTTAIIARSNRYSASGRSHN
jgi:hypothetical protein